VIHKGFCSRESKRPKRFSDLRTTGRFLGWIGGLDVPHGDLWYHNKRSVAMSHFTSTRPTELMLVANNTTFAVKLYQILSDPEDQHVSISWTLSNSLIKH
jgi:hypothetical protein